MERRIELFKATKESVLSQNVPFSWWLSFDINTPLEVINELCVFPIMYPMNEDIRTFQPEGWVLSTRLDNDDILLPNALEEIQTAAKMFKGREMVIDIGYEKVVKATGEKIPSDRPRPNSPFLSLLSNKSNCYCRPHTVMPDVYPSYKVDKVLAQMVLHGGNAANTVKS